jgi:hypothetical protein
MRLPRGVYPFDFAQDKPERRRDSSPRQVGAQNDKRERAQNDRREGLRMTASSCHCEADEVSRSNLTPRFLAYAWNKLRNPQRLPRGVYPFDLTQGRPERRRDSSPRQVGAQNDKRERAQNDKK